MLNFGKSDEKAARKENFRLFLRAPHIWSARPGHRQIKTSQTRRSHVRVASAVTKYLPEDGLLYATAVSFDKPVCSSSRERFI